MSWNYRLVKRLDGTYGCHEVYYRGDDDGEAWAMSEEADRFIGDTADEVTDALRNAHRDCITHPVFVEPETWAESPFAARIAALAKEGDDEQ